MPLFRNKPHVVQAFLFNGYNTGHAIQEAFGKDFVDFEHDSKRDTNKLYVHFMKNGFLKSQVVFPGHMIIKRGEEIIVMRIEEFNSQYEKVKDETYSRSDNGHTYQGPDH